MTLRDEKIEELERSVG